MASTAGESGSESGLGPGASEWSWEGGGLKWHSEQADYLSEVEKALGYSVWGRSGASSGGAVRPCLLVLFRSAAALDQQWLHISKKQANPSSSSSSSSGELSESASNASDSGSSGIGAGGVSQ